MRLLAKLIKSIPYPRFLYSFAVNLRNLIPNAVYLFRGSKYDREYDIDTTRKLDRSKLDVSADKRTQSWSYHAIDFNRFKRIMKHLPLDFSSFCFIDVGSGKGRVLFLIEELKCQHIIGIEHSNALHRIAENNLKKYLAKTQSKAQFELLNIDALDFKYPTKPTIVFLFNPFMEDVMIRFLNNLNKSLEEAPRQVWVVYVNPTERQAFEKTKIFKKFYQDLKSDNFLIYQATIGK